MEQSDPYQNVDSNSLGTDTFGACNRTAFVFLRKQRAGKAEKQKKLQGEAVATEDDPSTEENVDSAEDEALEARIDNEENGSEESEQTEESETVE